MRQYGSSLILMLLGCGPATAPMGTTEAGSTAGTDSGPTATSMPTMGTSATTATTVSTTSGADSTTGPGSTGRDFIDPPPPGCETGTEGGAPTVECDMFAQDCCPGDKCTAWANDGGPAPNATRCVPIDPKGGAPGSACTVMGDQASGLDDCDAQSYCMTFATPGPEGVCRPICEGDADEPVCPAASECVVINDGVLPLCFDTCDPLAPACPEAWSCQWWDPVGAPLCFPDTPLEPGFPGDPCEFQISCELDDHCIDAASFPGCGGPGCCTPYCDLTDPQSDAACLLVDPALACVPLFRPGAEPAGLEHLGVCGLP
ncbi:MAG: hypothetical protein K0V04_38525 [Deltaproteobacteria bacterium]|nr:hypothetical protein [Deltaproteobacteria bacterium]